MTRGPNGHLEQFAQVDVAHFRAARFDLATASATIADHVGRAPLTRPTAPHATIVNALGGLGVHATAELLLPFLLMAGFAAFAIAINERHYFIFSEMCIFAWSSCEQEDSNEKKKPMQVLIIVLLAIVGPIAITAMVLGTLAYIDAQDAAQDAKDAAKTATTAAETATTMVIPEPTSAHVVLQPKADLSGVEWKDRPTLHSGAVIVTTAKRAQQVVLSTGSPTNADTNLTVPGGTLKNLHDAVHIDMVGTGIDTGDILEFHFKQGATDYKAPGYLDWDNQSSGGNYSRWTFHMSFAKYSATETRVSHRVEYINSTTSPAVNPEVWSLWGNPGSNIDVSQDFTIEPTYAAGGDSISIGSLTYTYHLVAD